MDGDTYLDIIDQYVDLDTLLVRLRWLQDRRMLVADTESRDELGAACQLIERTKARLFAVIERTEAGGMTLR
jgi:hypothetical protein